MAHNPKWLRNKSIRDTKAANRCWKWYTRSMRNAVNQFDTTPIQNPKLVSRLLDLLDTKVISNLIDLINTTPRRRDI